MLGYTQVSWDNLSGQEQQPWSSIKSWASLTDNEKAAARGAKKHKREAGRRVVESGSAASEEGNSAAELEEPLL